MLPAVGNAVLFNSCANLLTMHCMYVLSIINPFVPKLLFMELLSSTHCTTIVSQSVLINAINLRFMEEGNMEK